MAGPDEAARAGAACRPGPAAPTERGAGRCARDAPARPGLRARRRRQDALAAAALREPAAPRAAWIALDEDDNDPAHFLGLLLAALYSLDPAYGARARQLLATLDAPGARAREIVGVLVNDLAEALQAPVVVVLDDLHVVAEPAVHVALDYLLARLPPHLHLLVLTRHDPPLALARLRARGELAEVRLPDLRFTADETAAFLNERLALGLAADDLALMQTRTEGWAAGLRLLAGSLGRLRDAGERTAFLASLAHTDRHVADFLLEEVLEHQEPAVRRFLLETAILNELTPALCAAVTGRADAADALDDLERRSLFVTAVEGADRVYRYHALFAAFLRERLARGGAERAVALHRRAAAAHPAAGQAIAHWLAAGDYDAAADRIEQAAEAAVRQGLVETVRGWITGLPPAVRDARPRLLFLLGLAQWQQADAAAARALLEQAAAGFAAAGEAEAHGLALAYAGAAAITLGDVPAAIARADQALGLPLSPPTRVRVLLERARAHYMRGEHPAGRADVEAALDLSLQAGGEAVAALLVHLLPPVATQAAGVERIEYACDLAAASLSGQAGPLQATVELQRAFCHLRQGRLDTFLASGERALALRERHGSHNPLLVVWLVGSMATTCAARGLHDRAARYFDLGDTLQEQMGMAPAVRSSGQYTRAWACWLRGDQAGLRAAAQRFRETADPRALAVTPVLQLMLDGLLHLSDGRYAEAEAALQRADAVQAQAPISRMFGHARPLLAYLYLVTDRADAALATFGPLLQACEAQGSPVGILREGPPMVPLLRLCVQRGAVADYAGRVLDLLGEPPAADTVPVPGSGERLTAREIELLRLLATGATNRAIAGRLVVSEETVKTHVAHILRKLDVSSRTAAAARARQLGILS
jgi:LuxR family maltose regulon positive regulatory protein